MLRRNMSLMVPSRLKPGFRDTALLRPRSVVLLADPARPEAQIMAQPTVMKRPVIQDGDRWYLGWDSATEAALTT